MIDHSSRRRIAALARCAVSCAMLAIAAWRPAAAQSLGADSVDTSRGAAPASNTPVPVITRGGGLIPRVAPLNPMAAARTGLYVQPYALPRAGWRAAVDVAYASAVEYQVVGATRYMLDAELLNVEVALGRDLTDRVWLSGTIGASAAFDGALDRLFDWYHARIGFDMQEREIRPSDVFADSLTIPTLGIARTRDRPGMSVTDVRLTTGVRWSESFQSAVSLTLPNAPGRTLFGRGAPTLSVLQTFRGSPYARAVVEGSGGIGYSPRRGELSPIQRELFWLGSLSTRLRLWRAHAAYGTLVLHSPTYRGTGLRTLDAGEVTADFGYVHRWSGGRELRIGLAEDIFRQDQGVDLALRISVVQ